VACHRSEKAESRYQRGVASCIANARVRDTKIAAERQRLSISGYSVAHVCISTVHVSPPWTDGIC